jgi:hypothetical protein
MGAWCRVLVHGTQFLQWLRNNGRESIADHGNENLTENQKAKASHTPSHAGTRRSDYNKINHDGE